MRGATDNGGSGTVTAELNTDESGPGSSGSGLPTYGVFAIVIAVLVAFVAVVAALRKPCAHGDDAQRTAQNDLDQLGRQGAGNPDVSVGHMYMNQMHSRAGGGDQDSAVSSGPCTGNESTVAGGANPICVIWGRKGCLHCAWSKSLLAKKGVPFVLQLVGVDFTKQAFKARFPKARFFPQIVYDGKHIGGWKALKAVVKDEVAAQAVETDNQIAATGAAAGPQHTNQVLNCIDGSCEALTVDGTTYVLPGMLSVINGGTSTTPALSMDNCVVEFAEHSEL